MKSGYLVDPARIDWQDATPFSKDYEDIYWTRGNPLEEKRAVFVDPATGLASSCKAGNQFTVAELGFGFGTNCLLTAEAWLDKPKDCQLNLVSIEKHPVNKTDLANWLSQLATRFSCEAALIDQYPPPARGQHVIWLADNIRLLLILDDVDSALANLDAKVDCWYLDGFAPARNEEMWQPGLYRKMFARSTSGAEVFTYSAAGHVRRGLENAGFETGKQAGFGRKKERLTAKKPGSFQPQSHGCGETTIVGAGLAGNFCAEALARRGIGYTLIDSGEPGPSHIPQLSVVPQLAVTAETRYRFSLSANLYMLHSPGFHACPLSRRGQNPEEVTRLHNISKQFPDDLISRDLDSRGKDQITYHQAGWFAFAELEAQLAANSLQENITNIKYDDGWHCFAGESHAGDRLVANSSQLILTTGFNRSLLPAELQVRAIQGHAISVETSGVSEITNDGVTLFPTWNGRSTVSGTYEREVSASIEPEAIEWLSESAMKLCSFDPESVIPMKGVRAVTRDRLPIVGQSPDWQVIENFNRVSAVDSFLDGLHFCTAFGSRGATHARLAGEHLVSKMLGEPAALGFREQQMLSPARFAIRDRKS